MVQCLIWYSDEDLGDFLNDLLPLVTLALPLVTLVDYVQRIRWSAHMSILRVLVVDDDEDMRLMLTRYLQQNGMMAMPAQNEEEIQKHISSGRIDLILLDVMLGSESGIEICTNLRTRDFVPIIMVSALSTDQQRMAGYEAGADDYISKPFNPDLLLARIRAVISRTRRTASLTHRKRLSRLEFSGWTYDGRLKEIISPEGYQVALSQREMDLLQTFLANPQIPLTRNEIASSLDVTGKTEEATGRAIDVLVGRLRTKIEGDPKQPKMIKTVRGTGYVLAAEVIALER